MTKNCNAEIPGDLNRNKCLLKSERLFCFTKGKKNPNIAKACLRGSDTSMMHHLLMEFPCCEYEARVCLQNKVT